jgi:glutaredoxin|tara:strand:+ start:143 stop:430 length:288 start_codon:yes stop_codon:yes gene_type:complete
MFSVEFNNMNFSLPTKSGYFMYSKSGCKFCKMAKELLPNVTVVNVDEHIETDKAKCLDKMATIAEVEIKTFPVIFFNQIFVGGYAESKEHLSMME